MDLDCDRIAYSVREVSQLAGIGQTTVYAEIKAGRLKVRKLGARTLVRRADLEAWLDALPGRTSD